jgi:hypothetical protein
MVDTLPQRGVLQVVPPAMLDRQISNAENAAAKAAIAAENVPLSNLAGYIRTQYEVFSNHRNSANGWSDRLLAAMRAFNGQYDPSKMAEIRKFGGSEVYARLIAMKCRGASSLLRDVYLNTDRPWGIAPPADPDVPPEIFEKIRSLVETEVMELQRLGQPIDAGAIRDRIGQLVDAARGAEKKQAKKRAELAEDKIDEILSEGGFYKAMAEFIVDLPLFPFACIKGPVVRIVPQVNWMTGAATVEQTPRLFWQRTSPFDMYWTPGASDIESADVIERIRLSRAELNDLLDLPGYNVANIRAVLDDYGRGGLFDNWDTTDSERAQQESRENPHFNRSGLINCLEFHGNVQGRMLIEYGLGADVVKDELRDYAVQAWLIGRHVIKCQLSPSPRKRHPYYITSFEKVPGTPVGNALPDILADIQEVGNATLRSLVNNLSIASGPQVVVNVDRLAPGSDGESLYPWKRWHTTSDPLGNNTQDPISFFHPNSNAAELLAVYTKFNEIADELSAIPKYMSGAGAGAGAGRTAAGLAMLMGNASKILQTVAANVDRDVVDPCLTSLYDMIMLTDKSGILKGDEAIRVLGVNVAVQRETQRARQLEFLQITANPIDTQIMGAKGRAAVLRSVSQTIGLDGEQIVPNEDQIEAMQAAQEAAPPPNIAEAGGKAQGDQPPPSTKDMGPRVRLAGGAG